MMKTIFNYIYFLKNSCQFNLKLIFLVQKITFCYDKKQKLFIFVKNLYVNKIDVK